MLEELLFNVKDTQKKVSCLVERIIKKKIVAQAVLTTWKSLNFYHFWKIKLKGKSPCRMKF